MPVWTFVVRGGKPVMVKSRGNPTLDHTGTETIWKVSTDAETVGSIQGVLESQGCAVSVLTEVESDEPTEERELLYGVGQYGILEDSCS